MGSASRISLQGVVRALGAENTVTHATGEHLLSACRIVDASPQLRAAFADPATAAATKILLAQKLFHHADPVAVRMLKQILTARWSNPAEMLDGIEQLGVRALARTDSKTGPEHEIFAVTRIIASDPNLELALGSKLGDPIAKARIVDRLLTGKTLRSTLTLVRHMVLSPRGRRIGAALSRVAEIVADENGARVAKVTAAAALTPTQVLSLEKTLGARYGCALRVNLIVDPTVVGGLRVQIGDDVIDGTIATRLSDLRIRLAS